MPIITDGLLGEIAKPDTKIISASRSLAVGAGILAISEAMRMHRVRQDAAEKIIDTLIILWVGYHSKSIRPAVALTAMTLALKMLPPSNKLLILKIALATGQCFLNNENVSRPNVLMNVTAAMIAGWAGASRFYAEYSLFFPREIPPVAPSTRARIAMI